MKKIIALLLMLFSLHGFAEGENSLKDVQFKDLNNNVVTLDQVTTKGKPVYIKMWASWCPICLAGLAEIEDLSADQSKNFDVITIVSPGTKSEKKTQDFIEWYKGLEYKNIIVLLDENGETIKRGTVRGYPSSVLLNADLTIQKTVPGHLSTVQIKQLAGN